MKVSTLLLICLLTYPAFGQTILSAEQKAYITDITERDVPPGAPGVACGIVQGPLITYTHFSGFANLEDSVLISEKSRFNIASNAKQFTALAILKLVEEKKLKLDEELSTFFPNFQYTARITIRQLLSHTSGIRDVYDLWGLQSITWWKQPFSNSEAISLLSQQKDLNFSPGAQYLYSNSNYILLAEIVAKVSGQSFQAYTNQMFQDLGLTDTAFESNHEQISPPIAYPYFNFDTWTGYDWIWNVVGDGNLFTTLADQLRWEQIIQDKKRSSHWRSILEKSQEKIAGAESIDYAYGLEFSQFRGEPIVFHHGSTGAWKATFMRFPERQLTIMTFSNSGKTDVVGQNEAIATYLLGKTGEQDFNTTPERVGSYLSQQAILGTYEQTGGGIFKFQEKEDGLYLLRDGRSDVLLERIGPNIWQQVYDPVFKQEFTVDENGNTLVTVYYSSHPPYALQKIETDWKDFDFQSLNGAYFNNETGVSIHLQHQTDQTFQVKVGDRERKGELLTPSRIVVGGYQLQFSEQKGQRDLYLAGDRIRKVYFQKE